MTEKGPFSFEIECDTCAYGTFVSGYVNQVGCAVVMVFLCEYALWDVCVWLRRSGYSILRSLISYGSCLIYVFFSIFLKERSLCLTIKYVDQVSGGASASMCFYVFLRRASCLRNTVLCSLPSPSRTRISKTFPQNGVDYIFFELFIERIRSLHLYHWDT